MEKPSKRQESNSGHVKVWDVGTAQETFTLNVHTGSVTSVCFSPDGTRLASGSRYGVVKLWYLDEVHEGP